MKSFVCTLAIGALAISAWADDKLGYQKRDWYDKDKLNTYDSRGRKTGYQKLDWYDKDKLNLFRRCP